MDNLTRTWKKRIAAYDAGQPIPKSHIYAFCKLHSRYGSSREPISPELMEELERLDARGFAWQITPEQTEQGLAWFKLRKVQKELNDSQRVIIEDFSHFLFVGVREYPRGHGFSDYRPVYRVCSHSGPWFDYVATHWRKGGWLEVLR
jgi:hypothetical protein